MEAKEFDVAVIGGGIVGCAVLFELTRQGYACVLLEKNSLLLSEASGGNSGMLHTGFDAPPESLELKCIKDCQENIFPILDKFDVPFKKCGTSVVAWTPDETLSFPKLQNRCRLAGVDDAVELSPSQLYTQEPFLAPSAHGALFVPGESVVDPNLLGIAYAHHAKMQGAKIITECQVTGFHEGVLDTSQGSFSTSVAINCSGLYGDLVDDIHGIKTFSIKPRQGQYNVYSQTAQKAVNSIIFPVPTEKTKGVALFKTVYGNVVVGPTAQNVNERRRPSFNPRIHKELAAVAVRLMPVLSCYQSVGHYTGVRPATQYKDYQIACFPSRRWISVGGIRSTGVSSSLGIGQLVRKMVDDDMAIQPRRGVVVGVEQLHWTFGDNGTTVEMDGHNYTTSHPICHFGHQTLACKL